MTGVRKNQLFTVQLHNGLLLLKHSVMNYYEQLKKQNLHLHGEKHVYTTWFVTVVTGVFHVNVYGVYRFQYFYAENGDSIITTKQLHMFLNYSVNMVQIFGSKEKRKIYYQKALHMKVARTVNLRKKRILWMFGLTQVHLTKVY